MEVKKVQKIPRDTLSARIPKLLRDAFWATKPEGISQQHVLAAAARLWLSMPEDERDALIKTESKEPGAKVSKKRATFPRPLPMQPEEFAILWGDLDVGRFLDQLRKSRPSLTMRLCHEIVQEALSKYEEHLVKEIVADSEAREAKSRKKKAGKKPKGG